MDPVRWIASFSIRWPPILPFERRQTELLDWVDGNLDIAGFTEDEHHVGFAISRTQRLLVRRGGLTIELLDPSVDGKQFGKALTGILDILKPARPTPSELLAAWSCELTGEYRDRCVGLARRATGLPGDSPTPWDSSILVDAVDENVVSQFEFGIVTGKELHDRLVDPRYGRLARRLQQVRNELTAFAVPMPDVALFVDCQHSLVAADVTPSSSAILAAMAVTEGMSEKLVRSLQAAL